MSIELPLPIAAYFNADSTNEDAVAECFTSDAVDEGETHMGWPAIKQWKQRAARKYRYTSEPLRYENQDDLVVVTSRLTGDFPGSPVDLRYRFRLEGDKIALLEIAP